MYIYIHIYIYMFKSTNDRLPWEPILKLAFRKCGCSTRMHFLYFCTQSCLFQNPCLTNERIMSHTWMSHVSRMSEKELRVFLGGDLINEKSYDVTMPGTIGYHQKKAFSTYSSCHFRNFWESLLFEELTFESDFELLVLREPLRELSPPKNGEIALLLVTNRWYLVEWVSQEWN